MKWVDITGERRCRAGDVDDDVEGAQTPGLVPQLAEQGTASGCVESRGTQEIRVECNLRLGRSDCGASSREIGDELVDDEQEEKASLRHERQGR